MFFVICSHQRRNDLANFGLELRIIFSPTRDRDRDRDTKRGTDADTQTDRHTDIHTDRATDRQRDRDSQRQRRESEWHFSELHTIHCIHARFKGKKTIGRRKPRWIDDINEASLALTSREAMDLTNKQRQWPSFLRTLRRQLSTVRNWWRRWWWLLISIIRCTHVMSQCLAVTLASPSLGGMLIIFSGGWGGGFGDFALNMDLFSYSFRFLTVKIHLRFEPVNPPPQMVTPMPSFKTQ